MARAHDKGPHMHDRFERFFSPMVLFGANAAIILAAEFTGGGKLFYEQGYIYVPIPLFATLVCVRIFLRSDARYDPLLRRFLAWTFLALAIQLIAYGLDLLLRASGVVWEAESVYGAIVSLQLASMLSLAFATFNMLQTYGKLRQALPWVIVSTFIGAIAFCAALATFLGFISNVPAMLYMGLAAATGLAAAVPLSSVERLIPVLRDFARHMTAAAVFLAVGAGANTVNLIAFGEPVYMRQATYVAHFCFFVAASFLFLGLGWAGNFRLVEKK